jgi:glutaredoxin
MAERNITLYRMKLPEHECPYGLRAKTLLEEAGLRFEDRLLTSREEVDAFKEEHKVSTTPLIFVDEEPIGGSDQLAEYLEKQGA